MSRSSAEAPGSGIRSGSSRAQVEPLAALAAVFAVTAALALYTGALQGAMPEPVDADLAPTALDAVAGAASGRAGVVDPGALRADAVVPDGHRLNVTLTARDARWAVGPPVPRGATDRAARRVAVDGASRTLIGRLRVVVW